MKNDGKSTSGRRHHRDAPGTYHCQGMGSMNWDRLGNSFLVHPLALSPQLGYPLPAKNVRSSITAEEIPAHFKTRGTPAATTRGPATDSLAEERLARAAKQLHVQAEESRIIFKSFYGEYTVETKAVRHYMNGEVRRQLWEGRIERNAKHSRGAGKEDERLAYQNDKLRTCLARFQESASDLTSEEYTTIESVYDSRALQIEKIRAVGERVVRLSRKALLNEAACRDVVTELGELRYLTDPKRRSGAQLYQIDCRGARKGHCDEDYEEDRSDMYEGADSDDEDGEVSDTGHEGTGDTDEVSYGALNL